MQERHLEKLFRDTARSAPPARFDAGDVAQASHRVTARRRVLGAGGSLVAAAALFVGVGAGAGLFTDPAPQADPGPTPRTVAPQQSEPRPAKDGPSILRMEERGDACGPPDPQLAAALAAQLPAVSELSTPVPAKKCPASSQTASYQVSEDNAAGEITVIVSSVGAVPADQRQPGRARLPSGTVVVTERADSGKVLIVRSNPEAGSPSAPYADRLHAIADKLAAQF